MDVDTERLQVCNMPEQVSCPVHGKNEGCMICQHLVASTNLGFARVPADDNHYETAMCESCEAFLLSEQEWSEGLSRLADWKLFCRRCYENVLLVHTLVAEGKET